MALDLRVWPVRTAPICPDGPRRAFQLRRRLLMQHRGAWDGAAEWTPVWIGFGVSWYHGAEPLPWAAHATLWGMLDSYAGVRALPSSARWHPACSRARGRGLLKPGLPSGSPRAAPSPVSTSSRFPGEAEPDEPVAALGVEVDPGRDRHAGLGQQAMARRHRVVGEVADVGVDVEGAVGRRQPVDARARQAVEQQRAGWRRSGRRGRRARRTTPSVKAAIAAYWASAGGQIVKLPVSTSTGRRRSLGHQHPAEPPAGHGEVLGERAEDDRLARGLPGAAGQWRRRRAGRTRCRGRSRR